MSSTRSTIWRILNEADLKPHRSVYWLNSHDPDFDAKAQDICKLYVQAPVLYQHGELVICSDEKTGMQILERKHPTIRAEPGKPVFQAANAGEGGISSYGLARANDLVRGQGGGRQELGIEPCRDFLARIAREPPGQRLGLLYPRIS